VLVLFLDGVGLGEPDPVSNPLARVSTPAIAGLLGGPLVAREPIERSGVVLVPTDATLGVPGLPQSATGQTALLTGLNAPRLAGRHVTAYPTAVLRHALAQHSVFARLCHAGAEVTLANAYSPEYFAAVAGRRLKVAAVTYAAQTAGVRLRTVDDVRKAHAVFHDLTNGRLRQWGYDLPELTSRESGRRLARLAGAGDLTFFEFFLTDLAAHGRVPLPPDAVVAMVDELLAGVLEAADGSTTVVVVSDHGNLEDDRSSAHTTNPVPTLAIGPRREAFRHVRDLTHVAPAMLAALGQPRAAAPAHGSGP
jgi:2,3-bisphosphoglycerate-independent phosphoglycerate mutase